MLNGPFSPWPSFTEEESAAVSKVLLSNKVNYWTGTEGREFEKEFAAWCEVDHAIALANGTVALDLAFAGLGIGAHYGGSASDEVIVTARTFLASVSSIVNAGAVPVFADVDADSGNITAQTVEAALSKNTVAIVAVHLAGWPCDMDPIMALAKTHDLKVIEDCAQAHGARYKGRPVGGIGHIGAWSFCQDKIMTTGGEGGMITTQDPDLWSRMWSFKDHGKSWRAVYEADHPPGFRWLHESFGTNWRMTEIQAVIGRIQLSRMADWAAARTANAALIAAAMAPFAGPDGLLHLPRYTCAPATNACVHAQYKFYAHVRPENLHPEWTRDRIVSEINALGVPAFQGTCSEVYREKAFDGTGLRPQNPLPVAQRLGETSLMFLVHPTLTEAEMKLTRNALTQVFSAAQKSAG